MSVPYTTLEKHIGLANINARLQLIYGEDASLFIESVPDEHTTICMRFPKTKVSDKDDGHNEL